MKYLAVLFLLFLAACQSPMPHATLGMDHELTGKIWSVADEKFVTYEKLIAAAAEARYVLLGEKHDNPDHHAHQTAILKSLIAADKRPAVAFEMLTWDQQESVDAFLKSNPKDASGLGAAVKWSKTGWPDWALYAPIANTAIAAGLPIMPANFSRTYSRKLARKGFDALPADLKARSKLDVPLSTDQAKRLEDEIFESHCRIMPRKHLGAVIKVQTVRDAVLADTLIEGAAKRDSAVLITGSGHARSDRAVPRFLHLRQPDARIFSLAFLEVGTGATSPDDYAENFGKKFPFDFVWFTARLEDIDPCEKFKAQLQKMKKKP